VVKLFQCRTLKNLLASQHNSLVIALNTPTPGASALWMIHPALVGAEAFYPFAQAFQGRINCFGIDNYNLYHRPPIDSLPTLAARYLDEMTAHGLLSGSSPVQIVGWSLGGLIALEVAALLEARGVGQVSLYLLDSFYQQAVGEQPSSDLLSALGITAEAAQRAMAIAGTEQRLAQGVISRRLMTTRVTLFKATQPNPQLPDDVMRELLAVQDNGLQQVCEDLTVIPLACHHHNILQCAEEIGEVIIRNKEGIALDKATELLQRADR
jgi:pimeloyl-ACP methyl ester carboxylesterase